MEKRIIKLEIILSSLLLFIPLILILINGEIRPSISDYAYSKNNQAFVMLLTLAGSMFVFNGSAYNTKWFNIILGCSLIGVAVTPHLDYAVLHYSFAAIFFLGSVFAMVFFSSNKQRLFKIIAGFVIIIALAFSMLTKSISLLCSEWIGILPISVHFIGEALGKID